MNELLTRIWLHFLLVCRRGRRGDRVLFLADGPGAGGIAAPPRVPSHRHLRVGHLLRPLRAEVHGVRQVAHRLRLRLQARRQGAGGNTARGGTTLWQALTLFKNLYFITNFRLAWQSSHVYCDVKNWSCFPILLESRVLCCFCIIQPDQPMTMT